MEPRDSADAAESPVDQRTRAAFDQSPAAGLLHLATARLRDALPSSVSFARSLAQHHLVRLSQTPDLDETTIVPPISPPAGLLVELVAQAPPMKGLEYLTADILGDWWNDLDRHVRERIESSGQSAGAVLRQLNPLWRVVGRVTFHLAENKRDGEHPFAFLATYVHRLSATGSPQHLPLARALRQYAGPDSRSALLALLTPIQKAAESIPWIAAIVESGAVHQPLAWTPKQAHHFLRDIPAMEAAGLAVRVPDWWKPARPPRPMVDVRIGDKKPSRLGADALLDFSCAVSLDGQSLSADEIDALLASAGGLVRLRGQWVELDRDRLAGALEHWKTVEREARRGGISFFEGMRLLAGAETAAAPDAADPQPLHEWTGLRAGEWLERTLDELRHPDSARLAPPSTLRAELRPYQQIGFQWLGFLTRLGLGACLADDMGLGKTVQVIALLLHLRDRRPADAAPADPSLLIVPTSLLANWRSELERFAPSISLAIQHSSHTDPAPPAPDVVMTTYGMAARDATLAGRRWNLLILDEAQAIKNAGTRQARAVKAIGANARVALTGTPVENRLGDLWSLFDFLNPGLLGGAKAFAKFCKDLADDPARGFAPLRNLVRPYILRRLKTDKSIIADLPDKTEMRVFCGLSRFQAALYERAVEDLAEKLETTDDDGMQRRGVVLASLMRFKQICNHPSQLLGDGQYDPAASAKFQRLAELCQTLVERQEKALVFTQFREITEPLAAFLQTIFAKPGLVLHGGTSVANRRRFVESFQREDGPPFMVLSIKAGGVGLNLTAASQVIHFDRWWNPAVENQATDRAFRIGQKRNVLVHKFVCRGTVEERIDQMIADKSDLAHAVLDGAAPRMLTEMSNRELLDFVALDVTKAVGD